jgi:hypothetical protein
MKKKFSSQQISKSYNKIFKYGVGEQLRLKIDLEDSPITFFTAVVTDHLLEEEGKDSYIPIYELESSKGNTFTVYCEEISSRIAKVHKAQEILKNSSDAEQDDEESPF